MPGVGGYGLEAMSTLRLRVVFCLIVVACGCRAFESSGGEMAAEIRVATFNVSCYRTAPGVLQKELAGGELAAACAHAEILQRIRPDIVLLNEFDYDSEFAAIDAFQRLYLEVPQGEQEPIVYPHRFVGAVNTGEPSGMDLDRDGETDGPADAFGYGAYPGVYGMVVLSRYPILHDAVRTFRLLKWSEMPASRLPVAWYGDDVASRLRLSSKSHQDVPVRLPNGQVVHVLASHPTPPVFDGPEDRNGRRNHDEIRLWADYVGGDPAGYIRDDDGTRGALEADALFVIVGDLNADPYDGDALGSIQQLLGHPRVARHAPPESEGGGLESAMRLAGINARHRGDPAHDTGEFGRAGNLRLDYVLPSGGFDVIDAGVFWPASSDPASALVEHTDHRLVWVDVRTR